MSLDKALMSNIRETIDKPLRIVFIGEVSCGKSSIINKIICKDVLPVMLKETSLTTFEIQLAKNKNEGLRVNGLDIELDQIEQVNLKERNVIPVKVNSDSLPEGILIYDTPGLSGDNEEQFRITTDALSIADVVFVVADSQQGLKANVMNFLKFKTSYAAKWVMLISKTDLLSSEEDLEKVLNHNKGLGVVEAVLPVSTVHENGIDALLEYILEKILPVAQDIKQEVFRRSLKKVALNVQMMTREVLNSIELNTIELDQKISEKGQEKSKIINEMEDERAKISYNLKGKLTQIIDEYKLECFQTAERGAEDYYNHGSSNFESRITELWRDKMLKFQDFVQSEVKDYSSRINDIAVDIDVSVPQYLKFAQLGFAILLAIVVPGGGFADLIPALLGGGIGEKVAKSIAVKGLATALKATIEKIIIEQRRKAREVVKDINLMLKQQVDDKYSATLDDVTSMLEDLRAEKSSKRLDVRTRRTQLKSYLETLNTVIKETA